MPNVNRLLVGDYDSHTTEERRIEDKMFDGVRRLKTLASKLDEELFDLRWSDASDTARTIASATDYMQKLEYRLFDVKGITTQFQRIQEHIDRIDAQLKEIGDE